MNGRIREESMEDMHLEMHLETYVAQCNALECLHSSEYHVCNLFQLQLYPYRMFVFTDYRWCAADHKKTEASIICVVT